jgi:hypothetical protein
VCRQWPGSTCAGHPSTNDDDVACAAHGFETEDGRYGFQGSCGRKTPPFRDPFGPLEGLTPFTKPVDAGRARVDTNGAAGHLPPAPGEGEGVAPYQGPKPQGGSAATFP